MSGYNFKNNTVLFCLKILFTFTNSVDPDEMQHEAAFHLGLHCLQKYSFRGFPKYKGLKKPNKCNFILSRNFRLTVAKIQMVVSSSLLVQSVTF